MAALFNIIKRAAFIKGGEINVTGKN